MSYVNFTVITLNKVFHILLLGLQKAKTVCKYSYQPITTKSLIMLRFFVSKRRNKWPKLLISWQAPTYLFPKSPGFYCVYLINN